MPGEAFTEVREHAKRQGTNVSEQRHSSAGRAAHRGHTTANAPAARPATGGFPAAHAQRRPGPQHGSRNLRPVSPFLGTKEQWVPPTRLEQGSASDSFPGGRGSPGGEERPGPPLRPALCSPAGGRPRPPAAGERPPPPAPRDGQPPAPASRAHLGAGTLSPRPAAQPPGPTHFPAGAGLWDSCASLVPRQRPGPAAGPCASRRRARGPHHASSPPEHTRASAARAAAPPPRRDDREAAAPTSPFTLLLREQREWGIEARNPQVPEMQRKTLKKGRPARLRLRPPFCTA